MSRRENSRIERQLFTEQPFVNNRVSHSVSTCINPVNYYNYTLLLLQSTDDVSSSYERKAPLPSSSSLIGLVDNNDRVVEGAAPNACRSPSWRRKSIISPCVIAPIRIPLLEKTEPATSSLPSFLPPSLCLSFSLERIRTYRPDRVYP